MIILLKLQEYLILIVLFLTFVYIHLSGYSVKSFYVSIFIYIVLTLYLLIIERFREKVEIEEKIKEIKTEREREYGVFLDKVKEID